MIPIEAEPAAMPIHAIDGRRGLGNRLSVQPKRKRAVAQDAAVEGTPVNERHRAMISHCRRYRAHNLPVAANPKHAKSRAQEEHYHRGDFQEPLPHRTASGTFPL